MTRRSLTLGSLIAMVLLAGIFVAAILGGLWVLRPITPIPVPVTAVITKIPAATPTIPVRTPTPAIPPTPTPIENPPAKPGSIAVGAFVQITGTGGDGLRLRAEPRIDAEVNFLGLESEVFEVQGGPEAADTYTWWFLVAPFDPSRNGWAVAPYLVVIENP